MEHNEDLDFLKGIGIALVVLGHCFTTVLETKYFAVNLLKDIIYTFHMPLFFIVSGYLQGLRPYCTKNIRKFSIHQMRKLFLPYVAWSLVLYVFYYLLNRVNIISISEAISLNPLRLIYDILTYKVETGNVLWFAYILCICAVVSYILHNFIVINIRSNIAFLLLVLCAGVLANYYIQDGLFVLKRFLVMWIYYEVGAFIGLYIKNINIKANSLINIVLIAVYTSIFIIYFNTYGIISNVLKVFCALLAVYILYSLSKYSNSRIYRCFNYLGKRTSYIYYLHNPYIVLVLVTALTKFTNVSPVISIAITFLFGIAIPLIIGNLILARNKVTKLILLGERI